MCWLVDKDEKDIPLPNVKGPTLKKVVEFMEYHKENATKEIEKPLKSANMHEVVPEWDANFVETDQETLFELILVRLLILLLLLRYTHCFYF